MTGCVVEIKRFAIHDGPGIRTTAFLKGCSLHCRWCHNPECIAPEPEIGFYIGRCTGCGRCAAVCPAGAHHFTEGTHPLDRAACRRCGQCVEACYSGALQIHGQAMTATQLTAELLEDQDFYQHSGGGITLSGGEPLLQADFCAAALRLLRAEGLHTAVDTCGNVPWAAFEKVLPVTDLFLFDLKQMDTARHEKFTGAGNQRLLENLQRLDNAGAAIEIRIPLLPGWNDDAANLDAVGAFLGRLHGITAVKVLPYHALARSKYAAVGRVDTMPDIASPDDAALLAALQRVAAAAGKHAPAPEECAA